MIFDLLNVKAWAMEARFFERAYPIAYDLISRGQDLSKLAFLQKEASLYPGVLSYDTESNLSLYHAANGAKVARINISGAITKSGDLCAYGTRDYSRMIEQANESNNIDAVLIEMDTPGGSVDGTPELGMAIKNSVKPIVVFGDGMVASAGYWAASQATEIYANAHNYTEMGSIGTLYVHQNVGNMVEAGNFPNVKIIRAPQSVDKAQVNPIEPLTADREAEVVADLKNITNDFINTVKAGRGSRLQTGGENIFTGKMYPASEALAMGMIDAIGTRQEAIDRAGELSTKKTISAPAVSGSNNKVSKMDFKILSSLFKNEKAGTSENLSAEDQATLEAAEQRLTEQATQLEASATRIAGLEARIAELTAEAVSQAAIIEAHEATINEQTELLDKTPAGNATTVIPQADEFKDGKNLFETSTDREVAKYTKLSGDETN